VADGNHPRPFAAAKAAWVWLDGAPATAPSAARFANRFGVDRPTRLTFHVSADNRYRLSLDGAVVSRGRHRGDLANWAFLSYEADLAPGEHLFEADVVWMGDHAPGAQLTWRPGFLFAADGALREALDTGTGRWTAQLLPAYAYARAPGVFHDFVGQPLVFDGRLPPGVPVPAVTVRGPQPDRFFCGERAPGWQLWPSPLPDMLDETVSGGQARAVVPGGLADDRSVTAEMLAHPAKKAWQDMLDRPGERPVTVPAGQTVSAVVDWEEYHLAYSSVTLDGAPGGEVRVAWAESFIHPEGHPRAGFKGHRGELEGKRNGGMQRDFFIHGPDPDRPGPRRYLTETWRSGRYVVLTVTAPAEGDLRVVALQPQATRYPLAPLARFDAPDPAVTEPAALMIRGLQCCSHETYFDCPHYEQLQYVGDTRLTLLLTYALSDDDRLPRRALDLFQWSRSQFEHGMSAERYPSRVPQESTTYGLLWPLCLRDFAWWRDDPAWVRARIPALRSTLEGGLALLAGDGLLGTLPGWSFVDWVPSWPGGMPPDPDRGSLVNLHLLLSLLAGADVEDAAGDPGMACRWRDRASRLAGRLMAVYWDERRGLMADDRGRGSFSEHAQCLALLAGILPAPQAGRVLEGLLSAPDLARTTVYFSFYLFEALALYGRGDAILGKLAFWLGMARDGFKTPMEAPEPSRSDCHAWSSHPLFHCHASLAGIRPAAPGFAKVRVAPSPGPLPWIKSAMPHPRGMVEAELVFADNACRGAVRLPEGVEGELVWKGTTTRLVGGANSL